jgi:hypothetical protein
MRSTSNFPIKYPNSYMQSAGIASKRHAAILGHFFFHGIGLGAIAKCIEVRKNIKLNMVETMCSIYIPT